MTSKPLESVADYSQFIAELSNRPSVVRSTITVWSASPYTGIVEGELFFVDGFRLRMREELDFDEQIIASYGLKFIKKQKSCIGTMISLTPMTPHWLQHTHITNTFRPI